MTWSRSDASFRRQVDRWVLRALDVGVSDFDELVCSLPGVYPPIVAESLDRLLQRCEIVPSIHSTAMRRRRLASRTKPASPLPVLPPPHPLDFDWRYAPRTIEALLGRISDRTKPGDIVALLGTPTLFLAAAMSGLDRRITLVDDSPIVLERLAAAGYVENVVRRDLLLDRPPELSAELAIADPPWYPEHIEAFLAAAARCTRKGGRVLVSLPSSGTRPGGRTERIAVRAVALAQGLRPVATAKGGLRYLSPPFEVNALKAAGWQSLPMDWRSGDVVELVADGTLPARAEGPACPALWEEWRFGWVRIRVRVAGATCGAVDPALHSLVDGDVLSDVSRQHPLRSSVAVWTSGNRVYGCVCPRALRELLGAMNDGDNAHNRLATTFMRALTAHEASLVSMTVSKVREVIRVETAELELLGWPPPPAVERAAS
jgi:hypothetical protein